MAARPRAPRPPAPGPVGRRLPVARSGRGALRGVHRRPRLRREGERRGRDPAPLGPGPGRPALGGRHHRPAARARLRGLRGGLGARERRLRRKRLRRPPRRRPGRPAAAVSLEGRGRRGGGRPRWTPRPAPADAARQQRPGRRAGGGPRPLRLLRGAPPERARGGRLGARGRGAGPDGCVREGDTLRGARQRVLQERAQLPGRGRVRRLRRGPPAPGLPRAAAGRARGRPAAAGAHHPRAGPGGPAGEGRGPLAAGLRLARPRCPAARALARPRVRPGRARDRRRTLPRVGAEVLRQDVRDGRAGPHGCALRPAEDARGATAGGQVPGGVDAGGAGAPAGHRDRPGGPCRRRSSGCRGRAAGARREAPARAASARRSDAPDRSGPRRSRACPRQSGWPGTG